MDLLSFNDVMEITGTFAFAVAGSFAAMEKRLDIFGLLVLAFVTSIGGGTIRDLLLGITPVSWLSDDRMIYIILVAALASLIFTKRLSQFSKLLQVFDALGLGFFTLVGINKALQFDLSPGICIALGTITGCFGGVLRDVLVNNIPLVFRKEIYASASIVGGSIYYLIQLHFAQEIAFAVAFIVIVLIRLLAIHYNWSLPGMYSKNKLS
jgi:uncharacterized membrane protein YeiH